MAWIIKAVAEALSQEYFNKNFPIFVDERDNHNCNNCKQRIETGGKIDSRPDLKDGADCTHVRGGICLSRGSCSWWNFSEQGSTEKDKVEKRMSYKTAGYSEWKDDKGKYVCHMCEYIDPKRNNLCKRWMKSVKDKQCCSVFDNEDAIEPDQPKDK